MARRIFFVTGYPRSRTAWLSVALSGPDSVCLHDQFRFVDTIEKLEWLFNNQKAPIVGLADPVLLLCWENLVEQWPHAHWLVVVRDIVEVRQAHLDAFPVMLPERLEERYSTGIAALKEQGALVVGFDGIDNAGLSIWKHCIGTLFDSGRWHRLCELNIQQNQTKAIKNWERTPSWAS